MELSKLPWRTKKRYGIMGIVDANNKAFAHIFDPIWVDKDELIDANAVFIIEACNQYDTLLAALKEAREALVVAHNAIKSLPIDALGDGEVDWNGEPCKYPIRDEVIDKINHGINPIDKLLEDE